MTDARFATAPTPGAPHDLAQVRMVAQALGTPLMPWQEQVARVATERLPENPKRFRYPVVVITVPRQSGKTTLMRTVLTQRALARPGRVAFYTAQTGKDATARWKDLIKAIDAGPFKGRMETRLGAGSQAIIFPNGSTVSPFAPTANSLHGHTPHDVMLDEVFAHSAEAGEDLMGAIKPAQITLPDRQLWLVSTMGTRASEFLHQWVETGRQAVDDPGAGVAYFEWSAADGLDYYDPATWAFHPALGHTITEADLAEAAGSHSPGEWQRAYMNRQSAAAETWVTMSKFDALVSAEQAAPDWADVTLAIEADPLRRRAAILAGWETPDGPRVRVVMSQTGTEWLAPAAAELWDEKRPRAIWADDAAETRSIVEQLGLITTKRSGAAGVPVRTLGPRDFATACSQLKAAIESETPTGRVEFGESGALRDAIDHVVTRPLGEAWAISRRNSAEPVCEAIAAAVVLRAIQHTRPEVKPVIRFGRSS